MRRMIPHLYYISPVLSSEKEYMLINLPPILEALKITGKNLSCMVSVHEDEYRWL